MEPLQFVIDYKDQPVEVAEFASSSRAVFRVSIPGEPPLFVLRASRVNGNKFWTSIPEGRQKEAEAVGKQIERHFNKVK